GLMIGHYTQAAMVAENRRLAVPASSDTLSTSASQEDHVSMAWGAARKLRTARATRGPTPAVEIPGGVRGLERREPLAPAPGTAAARDRLRADVPGFGPDRWLSPELAAAEELVGSGALVAAVEEKIGEL